MENQNSSIYDHLHDSLYAAPMRLIKRSPSEIVAVSKVSLLYRIGHSMGLVTVPLFLGLLAIAGGYPLSLRTIIILSLIALPFMIYSVLPFLIADVRTAFDKVGGDFTSERKWVLGRPQIIKRPLLDIKGVFVAQEILFFRIKLELVTGEQYPLSSTRYRLLDKPRLERQAGAIRQFIKDGYSQIVYDGAKYPGRS